MPQSDENAHQVVFVIDLLANIAGARVRFRRIN
jgi:hypothetical protein